jgi:hypothetical protein
VRACVVRGCVGGIAGGPHLHCSTICLFFSDGAVGATAAPTCPKGKLESGESGCVVKGGVGSVSFAAFHHPLSKQHTARTFSPGARHGFPCCEHCSQCTTPALVWVCVCGHKAQAKSHPCNNACLPSERETNRCTLPKQKEIFCNDETAHLPRLEINLTLAMGPQVHVSQWCHAGRAKFDERQRVVERVGGGERGLTWKSHTCSSSDAAAVS